MSSGSGSSGPVPSTPVFVIPERLDFYVEDRTTHKRIFTLYNPFDVDVRYKVLCNNPNSYSVVEPSGKILGRKFVDIVVRHHCCDAERGAEARNADKFRILLLDEKTQENIGKRDILAVLHLGKPDPSEDVQSHSLPHRRPGAERPRAADDPIDERPQHPLGPHRGQQPNCVACVAAVVCIVALCLPTEGEQHSQHHFLKDYSWLHLSLNQKLVFAYVLGLVTMAILRTT